jgi:ribosomal protein S18 acetylase RimI-like enzyme
MLESPILNIEKPFDYSFENRVKVTEENFWSVWQRFGQGPGCHLYHEGGATWFDTPLATVPYNGILRFQVTEDVEPLLDRIIAHFSARKVPYFFVHHPSCQPADYPQRLINRGFVLMDTFTGMTMDLLKLPAKTVLSADVEIRELNGQEELLDAYEMVAWRWEVPEEEIPAHREMMSSFNCGPESNFRCWIAYLNGEPVSKAILNLHGESAGVHGVSTKPEARGRGLARALTLECLHAGREAGYRMGMLHASNMAKSLYEKIGFEKVAEFHVYVPQPPASE